VNNGYKVQLFSDTRAQRVYWYKDLKLAKVFCQLMISPEKGFLKAIVRRYEPGTRSRVVYTLGGVEP
jgi:hypothetical protein